MKKLAEERYCNKCRYYLARIAIINNKFSDTGGDCGNNSPFYSPTLIPSEADGNCIYWESKEMKDDISF